MRFHTIEDAIREIKHGRMVVLVDDEDRENEGDLIFAAQKVTPQAINFMAKHRSEERRVGKECRL